MTIKEAIINTLTDLKEPSNSRQVCDHMITYNYHTFDGKTPAATVSSQLREFIRKEDSRVKRIKASGGTYLYYLAKMESELDLEAFQAPTPSSGADTLPGFHERDLHPLLSSYLKNQDIFSKTVYHEKSNRKDSNQKWVHPDMVGVSFTHHKTKVTRDLIKLVDRDNSFKIYSYELKKEINTDYELKEAYFQAVSNSSWANYGYLVAFEISDNLLEEIERLNHTFGIGIIKLSANPFESKILFHAKSNKLSFKTIDKLSGMNDDFKDFMVLIEKILSAAEKYQSSVKMELTEFCDSFLETDKQFIDYCDSKRILTYRYI